MYEFINLLDCDNQSQKLTKFKRNKKIEIKSEYKEQSLIRELNANKMVCVTMCQLECSCTIVESKKDETCQLFNDTALVNLIEKTEKENEFIYFGEM